MRSVSPPVSMAVDSGVRYRECRFTLTVTVENLLSPYCEPATRKRYVVVTVGVTVTLELVVTAPTELSMEPVPLTNVAVRVVLSP